MSKILSNIPKWKDYLRQNASVIAGKIQAMQGIMDTEELRVRRSTLKEEITDALHGEVSPEPQEMMVYLYEHPEILEKIRELMITEQQLMGRKIKQSELPSTINSYVLIALSLLLEDGDLTYGLANVTDEELQSYVQNKTRQYSTLHPDATNNPIGGKRRRKSIRKHRRNKKSHKKNNRRRTRRYYRHH